MTPFSPHLPNPPPPQNMVAESLGIPVDLQQYWICNPRLNSDLPSSPYPPPQEMVATSLGIPVDLQRYWICHQRINGPFRPKCPLTPAEEGKKLMELRSLSDRRVRGLQT